MARVGTALTRLCPPYALLLCALLSVTPAAAGTIFINSYAFGLAVAAIGSGTDTASDANVSMMTTTADVGTGGSIVVLAGVGSSGDTFSFFSDSVTNTYTETIEASPNGARVAIGFSSDVAALASSATITGTLSGNDDSKAIAAAKVNRAVSAVASAAAGATGTNATPTVTTGASIPAGAVVVGAVTVQNGTDTITLPAGWNPLFNGPAGAHTYAFAYKVTEAAGAVTFNPTNSASRAWSIAVAAYN